MTLDTALTIYAALALPTGAALITRAARTEHRQRNKDT